jgi:hypothetical protein
MSSCPPVRGSWGGDSNRSVCAIYRQTNEMRLSWLDWVFRP